MVNSVQAYKCLSCGNMISNGSYCSECSDTSSGCKCSDPTDKNYRSMWEKGLKIFDKVVFQLNCVEDKAEKLEQMVTALNKDNYDLKLENEHYRKVLEQHGIECLTDCPTEG